MLFLITSLLAIINFGIANAKPALSIINNDSVTFYRANNSSEILGSKLDKSWLKFGVLYLQIKAETAVIDQEDFNLEKILSRFSAKVVLTEQIDGVTSVYAYSNKIRYREVVQNKIVNLHLVINEKEVKVGCPIIYESF